MKKILLTALFLSAVAWTMPTSAQVVPAKEGFIDPTMTVITVAQAKKMKDDTSVILRGNIEKRIKGDDYLFRDSSGSIKIDIDDDKWNGLTVGPNDTVEIVGEVDKGWTKTEIDVKHIAKMTK